MGDLVLGVIVFGLLTWAAWELLKALLKVLEFAVVNIVSTVLLVGGVILGLGLMAGEASAAVSLAVPASLAVAKMRLSTGGF
ncbi:MAG: hypothetical protein QNJ19_09615 [Woeseiaceae bacterium]|nr:hypothetical protein [Woeseiaceae bacterium]